MQHVRVGEHQAGVFASETSLGIVGVAIEGPDPHRARCQLPGSPGLVVGQRLGRSQVEGGGAAQRESPSTSLPAALQRCEHRHQVGQSLPGAGGGADGGMTAGMGQFRELHLVLPWPLDPGGTKPTDEPGIEPPGPVTLRARGGWPVAHHCFLRTGHPFPAHPPNSATCQIRPHCAGSPSARRKSGGARQGNQTKPRQPTKQHLVTR